MTTTIFKRSETYTKDSKGQAVAEQRWYVGARPTPAAIDLLGEQEGVYYNTPFPGDDTIKIDSIEGDVSGDGQGTEIALRYSNDGRFNVAVLRRTLNVPLFDRSWEKVKVDIPINVRDSVRYSPVKGGEMVPTDFWTLKTVSIVEKRGIISTDVTFEIPQAQQFAKLSAIDDQQDKIHQFGTASQLYLFEAAPVHQIDEKKFSCKYSWKADRGTLRTGEMVDDASKLIWPLPYPNFPKHVRRPFSDFIVFPSSDARNIPHDVRTFEMYDRSTLDGWKQLPGIPPWL